MRRALPLAALAVACGGDPAKAPAPAADAGRDAPANDTSAPDTRTVSPLPPLECEPDLPAIERGVFRKACSFETCHGDNGAGASLSFIRGTTEQQLIGVTSFMCPDYVRVAPGAPEESFLWLKLVDRVPPDCGEEMPWGFERLPDPILDCVRRWIEELPAAGDAGLDSGD